MTHKLYQLRHTFLIGLLLLNFFSGDAQKQTIKRTLLQRQDISVTNREVIQVKVDFPPGSYFGKHSHPGEEVIYVLRGKLEYRVEGKLPIILNAGGLILHAGAYRNELTCCCSYCAKQKSSA